MPYKSTWVDRVYLLRWTGQPQIGDVDAVLAEVHAKHRSLGQPVIGVTIIPVDIPPPEGESRKIMGGKLDPLIACCETLHFVIEGSGFKNSVIRSAVTSVLMLTDKRGKITVHKTYEEALHAITPRLKELGVMSSRVTLAARTKGLLTFDAGASVAAHP